MSLEKEFIPFEESLALKELGFDEYCLCYYENNKLRIFEQPEYNEILAYRESEYIKGIADCFAPLYQQAFRWFRNKHDIDSWIFKYYDNDDEKSYYKFNLKVGKFYSFTYNTYEEAELACLRKLIEYVS